MLYLNVFMIIFFLIKKNNVLNFDLFFIRKKMLMIEKLIMNNFCL